jgi:hypothetical protein
MSQITICQEVTYCQDDKFTDENNQEKIVPVTKYKYVPINNMVAFLQTDYFGNIYLKYLDSYYMVTLDPELESGIELTRIKKPDIFRKNLADYQDMRKYIRSGTIKSGNQTLRGRVYDELNQMTPEEIEDYVMKNEYGALDPEFSERKYYWVQYKEDDEPLEEALDNMFYLNGITDSDDKDNCTGGIYYSDLLSLSPGTFDTILIEGDLASKHVVSSVERIDGYCTVRMTAYSSGHFRSNFVHTSKYARLCLDTETNELLMKKNKIR